MIDLNCYRWTDADIQQLPKPNRGLKPILGGLPRHARGERFLRGPIPLDWLGACYPLGLKAVNVALALWWLAGLKRTNPVRLTRESLAHFDVTPQTARAVLAKMERAGVVNVERHRGRGPDVTLLSI